MNVDRPRLVERGRDVEYRVDVESQAGHEELWFRVPAEYGSLVSDRSDAALLALLLPAMLAGEDLYIAGPVSEKLHYGLSGALQPILQGLIPGLRLVRIHAEEMAPVRERAAGVATGFSAGIDSFSVLADHHYGNPSPGFRLTHLLYNNVGSHGATGNPLFQLRYERLRQVAERIDLPFVAVDTNLMSFYDGIAFKKSYTLRNVVVSHLLQAGIGRTLHAAGTVIGAPPPSLPLHDIALLDPVILPIVSTEMMDAQWAGGIYSRVEKTLQVAEIADSYDVLDVCVRNDRAGNCSTCKKCVRVLLTLEIAGLLERYGSVFDTEKYQRNRHWRVARTLRNNHQMSREIKSLARQRGYRFQMRERLIAWTRLDEVRDWLVSLVARSHRGSGWLLARKARNSPLYSPSSRT